MSDRGGSGPDLELEVVFEIADAGLLPLVKSLLDSAKIQYVIQGEEALGLFPLGPLATGLTRSLAAATIRVAADRATEARELLAEFGHSVVGPRGERGGPASD